MRQCLGGGYRTAPARATASQQLQDEGVGTSTHLGTHLGYTYLLQAYAIFRLPAKNGNQVS